jgi:DNA-3-methyladenine glycosylase
VKGNGKAVAAAPWPWRSSPDEGDPGPAAPHLLRGDAGAVARELLGAVVRSTVEGEETSGVVVETEAYTGPEDDASHAASRVGRTERNRTMFGPPGRAYVYRSYGIHWCLNVVTGPEDFPAAVLLRALDPLAGRDVMRVRRGGREPLASGPGRLTQALGVTGDLDDHILDQPPLELLRGWSLPEKAVATSGRVGVSRAADRPLRFYLRGHPAVSPGPRR